MNDIKITQKPIADLIPYSRNPRRNDEAVPMVMNSIKEFGFKVPIVVDRNNIIVCGHTRFKAALKLGLETVPCIVADDLSDEQIKAFRLADNKVSEKAEWDFEILSDELDDIINIDMDSFGFESIEFEEPEEDDSEKVNERERTGNAYNLDEYDELRTIGFYQMPKLERIDYVPDDLVGFNYVLNSDRYEYSNHPFQKAYDKYGNVDAIIKRVNKVGKGKASILSDKAVEKMNADYAKELANRKTDYTVRSSKKGVNRHSSYWSAM